MPVGAGCPTTHYRAARTYTKAGKTVKAGTCVPCVSRLSAYHITTAPDGDGMCYKSVQSSAGSGCGAHQYTLLQYSIKSRDGVVVEPSNPRCST